MVPKPETLLIIDFGSQYNLLIARRVREQHVFCEILTPHVTEKNLDKKNIRGIILSGGPASIYDSKAPRIPKHLLKRGVPILGICYGMQALCHELGGIVEKSTRREYGRAMVEVLKPDGLFHGIRGLSETWMSHGDNVMELPKGFEALGRTPSTPYAACADIRRHWYGVQFHPEVAHTREGNTILKNFLFRICGFKKDWDIGSFVDAAIRNVSREVQQAGVILALSGGVDSSITAALLSKALGPKLHCVFVDNGLLRKGEAEEVRRTFTENFPVDLRLVNARARFLRALKGVKDPEKKRRIIGHTFIEVFQAEARKIKSVKYLAQGTLYPDVIESRSVFGGPSSTIKTHHNVGGLPAKMHLKLIEPLRELFKDEVREVGRTLGVPSSIVGRHPFPGPGLAVRIIGEVTEERLEILREADFRFLEELKRHDLYDSIWQAFCVLLPIKTVGVMGDQRTYENVIALRAVTSWDGMTADWASIPQNVLSVISNRIINEVRGVNRVVYDISSKPPATIEWE